MSVLSLILLAVSGVSSDSHSLHYCYTGVSAPGYGLPEFYKAGYIDDQLINVYTSDTRRSIPVAPWLKRKERPEHWETLTELSKEQEMLFRNEVKVVMKRFNHTGVRPRVKVTHRESGEATKLHCQVHGFHPRAVDVKWMIGEDEVPSYETTHVLPNPDGTYQIRVSAEVTPKEGDRYSCYVHHSSLEAPLLVQWEPPHRFSRLLIVGLAVGIIILAFTSLIAGAIVCKKKKENYMAARPSDRHGTTSCEVSEES